MDIPRPAAPPPDVVAVDLADDEPVTTPRFYRIDLPGEPGVVVARFAGEGDPVQLLIPGPHEIPISRDIAWALWAVLSDALMPGRDAIPTWALETVTPTDEHGRPIPNPTKIPF